ncbi:MAG: CrcB family protein, partial [Alphaproteobacteria bacterium]|nr:CrcB family protein [Alphaproteobacteria bacterium]
GRAFVVAGVCGGFTTFSSFSLQTLALARSGQINAAALYVGLSVILCLLAAWAGLLAGAAINGALRR